jgi:hypothetical protein
MLCCLVSKRSIKPDGKNRMEFWQKSAVSLHRCAMITIVLFDTMSDFAKFIPPKELVY